MPIDGETVKSAISMKLAESFPDLTIYKEKVVQGMQKPCFFIWQLNVNCTQELRNRYNMLFNMIVRYHPQENIPDTYSKCADIGIRCIDHLSTIQVENRPLQATSIRFEIVDDVLFVYADYSIRVDRELPPEPKMAVIDDIEGVI